VSDKVDSSAISAWNHIGDSPRKTNQNKDLSGAIGADFRLFQTPAFGPCRPARMKRESGSEMGIAARNACGLAIDIG
jgi:hypothetical protein